MTPLGNLVGSLILVVIPGINGGVSSPGIPKASAVQGVPCSCFLVTLTSGMSKMVAHVSAFHYRVTLTCYVAKLSTPIAAELPRAAIIGRMAYTVARSSYSLGRHFPIFGFWFCETHCTSLCLHAFRWMSFLCGKC